MMIALLVGVAGMICILVAFVLDEFYDWFNQETRAYNVLNMFGSGLLMVYGFSLRGWPFVVLNAVWFIVAAIKLVKVVWSCQKRRRKLKKFCH